jgi:hypothetical protein
MTREPDKVYILAVLERLNPMKAMEFLIGKIADQDEQNSCDEHVTQFPSAWSQP